MDTLKLEKTQDTSNNPTVSIQHHNMDRLRLASAAYEASVEELVDEAINDYFVSRINSPVFQKRLEALKTNLLVQAFPIYEDVVREMDEVETVEAPITTSYMRG